ncbi:putative bifunctional diguanylate cyclase/phosphodiesterase [Natronospira sp.]|uniref:putative bifunctional diguanylate cyclase/phosphodiesterase n=1 Tax=Natronospira sp. TaxID=2024970 RepID=UPI0038733200
MQGMQGSHPELRRRLKVGGLVAGLFLVFALATALVIFLVQLQGAATAYMAGQSHWSRAQLGSVFALYRYAQEGEEADLVAARELADIPIGDMEARLAMEAEPLDRDAAVDGLIRGQNHPDDIPIMIWLFRNFADFPHLREAVDVWRESDEYILSLLTLADRLEQARSADTPDEAELNKLLLELEIANAHSYELTSRFVAAFTEATRWLRHVLLFGSSMVMAMLAGIATLLGWRLMRLINRSRRRFQSIFEQAAVGMAELTPAGRILNVNEALGDILVCKRQALVGRYYQDLVYGEDRDGDDRIIRDLLQGSDEAVTLERRFHRQDGGLVWGRLTLSAIQGKRREPESLIAILEDVSESRRLSIELAHQAAHDGLTGLINRRSFDRELAQALREVREEHVDFVVCFIDLDQFKLVNDTSGHVAGDHMLVQVAELLRSQIREGDVLARLGGDEFGLLLRACDLEKGEQVASKICNALEGLVFEWEEKTFNVACSIGVVPIEADMPNIDSVLRSADLACYIAKEQGRNRVHASSTADEHVALRRGEMEWVNRIRQALEDDRLYLDAQIIEPLQSGKEFRYELLLRLLDEDGRSVPPGAFIPAAERFGAAYRLDRWVFENTCRTLADHPEHREALTACHVNLSGQSFDRPEFTEFVVDTLSYYGIEPDCICFEITETAAIRHLADATSFMKVLRSKGCQFALDDFGAGLSSFGYLRRLPVDYLKIDGAFVRNILVDEADLAMVKAIKEIGHTMNKQIIAEFVETRELQERLQTMGIDYGQGFGIHRPERWRNLLDG